MNDTVIVVVSYNTRDLTLRAVGAARRAAIDVDAQLVVADNGSSDGTCDAVRAAHPGVSVLCYPDNPGYGAAINRAACAFPASYLCALNADVLLEPGSLVALRRFLDSHQECALVGPRLTGRDGTPQPSCKRFPWLAFALGEVLAFHAAFPGNRCAKRFYYSDGSAAPPAVVDAVSGAAMLIRGDAFRRIGGFDDRFRMYFEETDLCQRFHKAGFSVAFCPDASAIHWHGASTIHTSVREVEYYLSYIRYFRKHHSRAAARVLWGAIAVRTLARMMGLTLKYTPVSRVRWQTLKGKLYASAQLLWQLRRAANRPGRGRARA